MDNLFAIYDAYKSQANIHLEVKSFIEKDGHSPNFRKIMERLRRSMILQESTYIDEVTTVLMLTTNTGTLKLEAEITKDKCVITQVKRIQLTESLV